MDNIPDSTNMGRDARVELVLDYLVETGVALPVACLHRNLVLNRHATFSSTSLRSYLKELHEEGLVRKIDNEALDQREVREVRLSQPGYFQATETARQRAVSE
jgi:hypothetical protein